MAGVKDLPMYGMLFLLFGVISIVGLYIITETFTYMGNSTVTNQTVGNVSTGFLNLASWTPIIAIVVAAALILGLIIHSFGK